MAMVMTVIRTLVLSGAPQAVPTFLRLAGEMRRDVSIHPSPRTSMSPRFLPAVIVEVAKKPQEWGDPPHPSTLSLRRETHAEIYKASATPEVFQMLGEYFGDVKYGLIAVAFGLFMGGEGLKEKELMFASAILAMGAKREAGSHLKACFRFGWSGEEDGAAVELVERAEEWCQLTGPEMDIEAFEEVAKAMAKREQCIECHSRFSVVRNVRYHSEVYMKQYPDPPAPQFYM